MRDNRMNRLSGWVILILTAAITTLELPRLARAEDLNDSDYGSTYARVRHVEGVATLHRFMDGEVIPAEINDPLESGDRVATAGGRLEIGLADGATLWLDENTSVDLRSLSDLGNQYEQTNLLALIEGSIRIDTGDPVDGDSQFQIDTEGGSIYLLSAGSFRIDAERGITTLSSFRGAAELSGDRGSMLVRSGERATVEAGAGPGEARAFNTLRLDDFDLFHDDRIAAYLRRGGDAPIDEIREAVPVQVRPYVLELSVYGGWHHHGDYGWVWRPAYHGDWGPYGSGRWVLYPTGWVWISYDQWGWAPYHYGRWDHTADFGWIWIPGARWSGAWVSFAVGYTSIGWCPLNYYNYPVYSYDHYKSGLGAHAGNRYKHGWRFSDVGHFGARHGVGSRPNADRHPRDRDVVITGGLPRFNPMRVAGHEKDRRTFMNDVRGSRAPSLGPAGQKVPFHELERERTRTTGRVTSRPGEPARKRDVGSVQERKGGPADLQRNDPVIRGPEETLKRPRRPADLRPGKERTRGSSDRAAPSKKPGLATGKKRTGEVKGNEARSPGDSREMKRTPRAEKRDPVVKRLMRGVKSDRARSTQAGGADSSKSRATSRSSSSKSRATSQSRQSPKPGATSSRKGTSKPRAKSGSSKSSTSKSGARSRSSNSGKSKGSVKKSGSKSSSKSARSNSSRSSSKNSSGGRSSSQKSSSGKPKNRDN